MSQLSPEVQFFTILGKRSHVTRKMRMLRIIPLRGRAQDYPAQGQGPGFPDSLHQHIFPSIYANTKQHFYKSAI